MRARWGKLAAGLLSSFILAVFAPAVPANAARGHTKPAVRKADSLDRTVSVSFQQMPVTDALAHMAQEWGVSPAVKGDFADKTITLVAKDSLRSLLHIVAGQAGGYWRVSGAVRVLLPLKLENASPRGPTSAGSNEPAPAPYTGLIVDCYGLKIARDPFARILDASGACVYGELKSELRPPMKDCMLESGLATYCCSMEDATAHKRVGSNPLIVKATDVVSRRGSAPPTDPVLSCEDAKRVREEDARAHAQAKTALGREPRWACLSGCEDSFLACFSVIFVIGDASRRGEK